MLKLNYETLIGKIHLSVKGQRDKKGKFDCSSAVLDAGIISGITFFTGLGTLASSAASSPTSFCVLLSAAYSNPGYYSNMLVYTSYDGYSWTQVGQLTVSSTSPIPYVVGNINYGFKYVAVVGYDQGNSVALHVDCLWV
jgi:hypothetical protein